MASVVAAVGKESAPSLEPPLATASDFLTTIVEENAYVGEVYSLGYEEALVQIHDFHRRRVGGIPALSFLIATRVLPGHQTDVREEDSSLILLRVLDKYDLPDAAEALRVRVETAKRVSGEVERFWDHKEVMDAQTAQLLGYAGVKCRVLGTFYVNNFGTDATPDYRLIFGSDLSNYYPNQGLKVFKPRAAVLAKIVNYRDPLSRKEGPTPEVKVGHVRYASTNRPFQKVGDVPVLIAPTDLLGMKTALFGMTRTGKSNTTKVMLKSIFALRWHPDKARRIGQVVFDPNGEYANENEQDQGGGTNPVAIKNVWMCGPPTMQAKLKEDVVTYGITKHPHDPNRKLMLLNFYVDENLSIGKEIIDNALADDGSKYVANFRDVNLALPESEDKGDLVRHHRRVLCYRALLHKGGLKAPATLAPSLKHGFFTLFGAPFIDALATSGGKDEAAYKQCAIMLRKPKPSWGEMVSICTTLDVYISDKGSAFNTDFDPNYVQENDGSWADDNFRKILAMFGFANGSRLIGRIAEQHTETTGTDYADDIYNHLVGGRLVIIDQSSGDPIRRLVGADAVQQLLKRAKVAPPNASENSPTPKNAPNPLTKAPAFVVGIDGSYNEVPVRNGYPGAHVGYCTVASVLINLKLIDQLDEERPVDPQLFRKTEEAATVDAALPGSNVVTRNHTSARDAFRETVFDVLHDKVVDEEDRTRLLDTYQELLARKPPGREQLCPYDHQGCDQYLSIPPGTTNCPCGKSKTIYSTDALRIHERFSHDGTNGEAFGLVSQVWEKILVVHLLRCFERQGMLDQLFRLAFVLDGPLGVFGPPAWLSAAISAELKRINGIFRKKTGTDLLILGIEKTGTFVTHFEEIDQTEEPGVPRFKPRSYLMLCDRYIKDRISLSDSQKRYGVDTYFGRKFFYKTSTGSRIVASIPFLTNEEDTLDTDDVSLYPQFGTACALLDKLSSNRYPNAVTPLVSAHAEAAIPLELGRKVLQQLAKALMRRD